MYIYIYIHRYMYFIDSSGCLEGRFELKLGCRKQPWEMVGPSRARGAEKYRKMRSRGCIWEHFEVPWSRWGDP